ncbi:dynein associated protein-domain-containing protein [Leucosporidium creatinivorum]|uniref:Dynein associated protein-domain-containing protein n=1 Tax=Leucosporidium creatinivorum TaxID=106004 RepID=A0A1Y2FXB2_9BASI|nr:dynein associated protein-domain-containing protein [Leucosporidium creatinivorum]
MANTATPPPILSLSTRVQVAAGAGYIRFVGQTSFATGKWVGVELDLPGGKNDGSVAGKRYFNCQQNRGVFVRPSQIRLLLDGEGAEATDGRESPTPTRPRPSSSLTRPSLSSSSSRRPSSSAAVPPATATLSGRSSSASSRAPSPAKPALSTTSSSRPPSALGPQAPKLASRSSSTTGRPPSSTGSSTLPPPGSTRKPSISSMLPPPTPSSSSSLRRPPSVTGRTATTNFAPPSGGISRMGPPPPGSAMKRGLSASSAGSSAGGGGGMAQRRASMARSPPPPPVVESRTMGMERQLSGTASSAGEGLLSEEEPMEEEEEPEAEAEVEVEEQQVEEEKEKEQEQDDPFSLRNADRKKLAEATIPRRAHEELLAKLRILESRRSEDRERLRELERLKEEGEEWKTVKERSKSKIMELAAEVKGLKSQNHTLSTSLNLLQSQHDDLSESLELALLDKEVAEEKFEAANAALEGEKERAEERGVEVGVLRGELERMEARGDAELAQSRSGGEGDEPRSSLAFIQLEKQNERLKDALYRLRELTTESESESRKRIHDLEKELDLTSDLQADYESTLISLDRAETQIEDLKTQLDDALGAEEMLEELTARNLNFSERLEELHATVEDLEALKELNDELEESHVETEKQMQEELDLKDLQLRDLTLRGDALEESVADYETTIGQFRELVGSLQADLDQLRQHQQTRETESQSLTSQSQAMLNLNLKLQSSVLKGQVKTIELELRKLEARQAGDMLGLIKPYLLPSFFEQDSDAVDSLLFFQRLAYKTDLIAMIIEQRHNVTDSLNSVVPEGLVGVCETRATLSHFSSLNKRFAAQLKRCPPDVFLKMGRIYHEVLPVERRMDAFVEALRKEELREVECGREVEGFIAQSEHLAEVHLQGSVLDLAEREQGYVASVDLDFDTIAAAAGWTKQALATMSRDPDVEREDGDANIDDSLFKPLQNLVNQARNAKVVTKKLLRRLDELVSNSSALALEHAQGFETLAYNSSAIASAAAKLATDTSHYLTDVRTSKQPFQLSAVLAIAKEIAATELGKQTQRPLEEINALLAQLVEDVGTTLATAGDGESVVKLAYDPPWIARVAELQQNAAINVDAERKVVKLNEEMRDLVREMRIKDQSHQESSVKIELMEKRMEAVKKQGEAMTELEAELGKAKKQTQDYEDAMTVLQKDLDDMEAELNKVKQVAATVDKQGAARAGEGDPISYEGNMETSYLIEQISSLRGAIRFLRSENSYLKSQDLLTELDSLPSYAVPPLTLPPSPPHSPTGLPSTRPSPPPLSFALESKLLLREARLLSSTPRLVDLSTVKPGGQRGWQPKSRAPRNQWLAEKERASVLGRKVERLWEMRPTMMV